MACTLMAKREHHLRARLERFLLAYGRTSRRGGYDPNDRHYDRSVETKIKRMDHVTSTA
jgi:hypothetical protein